MDDATNRGERAVRIWLWSVALLVLAMVIVGGATRLTESGLSIVEWKPVTGAIPPRSDAEWRAAFDGYRAIPQYALKNRGMTLAAFKEIYWWEWAHRLLGRLVGVAFVAPLAWLAARGAIPRRARAPLVVIGALGALQGAVGWWMVSSGLAHRLDVSQYRLATHLSLACVIYVALVWTAESLAARPPLAAPRRARAAALALVALVLAQIYLGALVAGLHAGAVYNSWPLIAGGLVPPTADLFALAPAWRNAFENMLTVQFDHRTMAYGVAAAAAVHAFAARRTAWRRGALLLVGAVGAQAAIGVVTLLTRAPLGVALVHQCAALGVLTVATLHARRVAAPRLHPR